MQYLGSPEFANARQAAQSEIDVGGGISGFLTANMNADQSLWNALEQGFLEMLQTGDPVGLRRLRPDARRGRRRARSGPKATSLVNGDEDAQTAADNIEASWPAVGRLRRLRPRPAADAIRRDG